MQEKVEFAPPVTKIWEGKVPPNSWVNENIMHYFQVKSEEAFLNDLLYYVQGMQEEQLSAARPKGVAVKEKPVPLPEKGSAEEIANTSSFNTFQGNVKTQLESLEKLINILKKADPALSEELAPMLSQLQKMAKGFPKLSEEELKTLSEIMAKLSKNADKVPLQDQRAFWDRVLKMLHEMMMDTSGTMAFLKQEIKNLEQKDKTLADSEENLKNIMTILQAKPPTSEQLNQLLNGLQQLANAYVSVLPETQTAMLHFFQQLGKAKNSKGENLAQLLADALVQGKIQEFLKSNPNATPREIVAYLKKYLGASHMLGSKLPLIQGMGRAIEENVNDKKFPFSKGKTGIAFAAEADGKVEENSDFVPQHLQAFDIDTKNLPDLEKARGAVSGAVAKEGVAEGAKRRGYGQSLARHEEVHNGLGRAAAHAAGKSNSAGSLPNQFKNAILGHYMPGQEAYLRQLAMWLFIDNMGAEMGNALLNLTLGFSESADKFDFRNWLHQTSKGDFTGNYDDAVNRYKQEVRDAKKALKQLENMISKIQSQISRINQELQNPNLSGKQRAALEKMKTSLENEANNAKVAEKQVNSLLETLSHIKITKSSRKGHFNITWTGDPKVNWLNQLGQRESDVINGNPKLKPPGGLVKIASDLQAFQQKYADLGQNQQMILQMRMTEIQQEWTVVSTALQLLNQTYMTIAQAIYK